MMISLLSSFPLHTLPLLSAHKSTSATQRFFENFFLDPYSQKTLLAVFVVVAVALLVGIVLLIRYIYQKCEK